MYFKVDNIYPSLYNIICFVARCILFSIYPQCLEDSHAHPLYYLESFIVFLFFVKYFQLIYHHIFSKDIQFYLTNISTTIDISIAYMVLNELPTMISLMTSHLLIYQTIMNPKDVIWCT
jgi:hypothetical protein